MDTQLILGYWKNRGLAQVPRLLLTYTKATWKDKIYLQRDPWFNDDKKNLGLIFPNLPYLIQGNIKITQSTAIQRYIINRSQKKQLLGKDIKDQALIDCMLEQLNQIHIIYSQLFFTQHYQQEIKNVQEKIEKKLQYFQNVYGNKSFVLNYLTLIDFIVAQHSYYIKQISQKIYDKFTFLDRVRIAIDNLPQIKSYYQQENAIKQPFLQPNATLKPKLF